MLLNITASQRNELKTKLKETLGKNVATPGAEGILSPVEITGAILYSTFSNKNPFQPKEPKPKTKSK